MSPPPKLSRRSLTIGGIAVAATAAVAGAVYELPRLFRNRARGEYADLANLLDDTDQAAIVGRALPATDIHEQAAAVRTRLQGRALSDVLSEEAARGALVEAGGWVLPETLGTLCAMAAA